MGAVGAALADAAMEDMSNQWACGGSGKSTRNVYSPHKKFPQSAKNAEGEEKANSRFFNNQR